MDRPIGLAENGTSVAPNSPKIIERNISASRVPQAWRNGATNSDTLESGLLHCHNLPVNPLQATYQKLENISDTIHQVKPALYDSEVETLPDSNHEFQVGSTSGPVLEIGSNRECALGAGLSCDHESSNTDQDHEAEAVSGNGPESEKFMGNFKLDSQTRHQHTQSNYLAHGTLQNSACKTSSRCCKNLSNSEGSLKERGDTSLKDIYLESYRPSVDMMNLYHSHDHRPSLFERSSNLYRKDTFESAVDVGFGHHHQLGSAYYKSDHSPSRSKYRLCFTSDLSESSSEEEDMQRRLNLPMEGNVAGRSDMGGSVFETDLAVTQQELNGVPLSSTWLNSSPSTDDLVYSENFEDMDYDIPPNSSASRDNLLDSLGYTKFDKHIVQHTRRDTIFHREGAHLCRNSDGGCRLQAMSIPSLRKLYKLLKTKMEDTSQVLVDLLIQREMLLSENVILHQNIARLSRTTQSLYKRQSKKVQLHHHSSSHTWRSSSL